ncbi:D-galactosamine-6-phosphate deaminase AgaS [Clostridium neonatale]|uniref:SIS domain-containing protein n=1 Tax=Clostridium neonatale TaxID=137838 RepID=UPI0012E4878E|nr:SIS domain-containing protein [Clostridium neonatale]SUQ44539.1 D-galactosamine-6-phosphate deaminase AgaS [Clostridium neonatale]
MIFGKSLEELEKIKAIFTATEIRQQPELWRETYKLMLDQKENIQRFIDKNVDENTRIVLTGAGTSDYVGDTVVLELNKKLNARVEAIATTDIVSNPKEYIEKDTKTILVSYARSGNSPESIGAYDLFENNVNNIFQIVITCNKDGDLAKKCINNEKNRLILMPEKSNDKSFAMTSSFSCMTLATLLVFDIENIEKNKEFIEIVSLQAEEILDNRWLEVKELVDYECDRVVYLGSGMLKGLCQEMALKNLELTSGKVTTVCESVLGFRHGPKSIINDKTLVIIMATNEEYTKLYDIDLIKEIHNDLGNHKLTVITYENDEAMKENCSNYICINGESVPNIYKVFNYMIFGQMFGYLSSLKLNISPDNPRPDGTVNRVVKGVVIHQYK